jgi:beta-galactosidase
MTPLAVAKFLFIACVALQTCAALRPMELGVCYYPEQWPQDMWASDFQRMHELGLSYVRIGEFSWSSIEPSPGGQFSWGWLDAALDLALQHNMSVVLGTPTATPPKWLMDKHAGEIEPYGRDGQPRRFGSRRHYSFSSATYWNESRRIVSAMAARYGAHPAVVGWQIDNEYGCHDTVRSFDPDARRLFRAWLVQKYAGDIGALNAAWGNSFWSMLLGSFDEVELPNLTVTEANPAAWMDFYRFSSDQLNAYHTMQAEIVRAASPHRFVTTNMMGFFFQFDAFKLANHTLDFVAWDNYPLGFTDTSLGLGALFTDDEKARYFRTGHPDLASFHHALYRGMGMRGEAAGFWVMEQQPGPVNWASHNPSPAPGMVRLWSLEAFSYGASVVSFFRWRQAQHAQEQMHSGLNRPDNRPDVAFAEVEQLATDLEGLRAFDAAAATESAALASSTVATATSLPRVALLVDFEAQWMFEIQPQGAEFSYVAQIYSFFAAARALALDVHILSAASVERQSAAALGAAYRMLLVPSLATVSPRLAAALAAFAGPVIVGPRTGSKTANFSIPDSLPPSAALQSVLLPFRITRVESLRPNVADRVASPLSSSSPGDGCAVLSVGVWREWVELDAAGTSPNRTARVLSTFASDNRPAIVSFSDPLVAEVRQFPFFTEPSSPAFHGLLF